MNYSIKTIAHFDKELKRLIKKHPSLKADFITFISSLTENPTQGTSLGKNCYKIRLAIKSKAKGKSGGARVITNIVVDETTLYLLAIYDKADKENVSDNELLDILEGLQRQ